MMYALIPSASVRAFLSIVTNGNGHAASIPGCIQAKTGRVSRRRSRKPVQVSRPTGRSCSRKFRKVLLTNTGTNREMRAEIRAKHARGEKLDSEIPTSMMQCACGIRFDSHLLAANLVHLPHIYAAQSERKNSEVCRTQLVI